MDTKVAGYLDRMIESGRIGHALLFAGPPGSGKREMALHFAAKVLGRENHPDLHIYTPDGKAQVHSIESIRNLSAEVALTPFEGPRKIFIIEHADQMPTPSANALLKTFEEPTKGTIICLITDRREALLPTILSRCCTLFFSPQPHTEDDTLREVLIRAIQHHNYAHIEEVAEALDSPQAIDQLFTDILFWYRDLHLLKETGDTTHIYHKNHIPELMQQTKVPPLETATRAITKARHAIQRHTKPAASLEALFLELNQA